MSVSPDTRTPPPGPYREPWPDIDRLTADATVDLPPDTSWYASVKVVFDYTVALAMFVPAVFVVALAAAAIKLSSPGPVFYNQTRVGLHGRRYKIFKLRSMRHNCELRSGVQWSTKGDNRITRVGKFLRLTHIDELPQLLNVLLGQMSLVGPRPERPEVIDNKGLNRVVPGYRLRSLVKPGVTGLAQVQLPADTDLTSVRYKVVYDLYYAQHQSLWLDARLLLATACKACGLRPTPIRRLFLLPGRDRVAEVFQANVSVEEDTVTRLLPA